jgi:hypothetical protein
MLELRLTKPLGVGEHLLVEVVEFQHVKGIVDLAYVTKTKRLIIENFCESMLKTTLTSGLNRS